MKIVGANENARQPLDDVIALQDHLLSLNDLPIELLERYCEEGQFVVGYNAIKQFRNELEKKVGSEIEGMLESYLNHAFPGKKLCLEPQYVEKDNITFMRYELGDKTPIKEVNIRIKKRLFESLLRNNLRNESVLDLIGMEFNIHDPSFEGSPSKKQRDKEKGMTYEIASDFLKSLTGMGEIRPFSYIQHYKTTSFFNEQFNTNLEACGLHQKIVHKNINYYLNILHFQDEQFQKVISDFFQEFPKEKRDVEGFDCAWTHLDGASRECFIGMKDNLLVDIETKPIYQSWPYMDAIIDNVLPVIVENHERTSAALDEIINGMLPNGWKLGKMIPVSGEFNEHLLSVPKDNEVNIYHYREEGEKHVSYRIRQEKPRRFKMKHTDHAYRLDDFYLIKKDNLVLEIPADTDKDARRIAKKLDQYSPNINSVRQLRIKKGTIPLDFRIHNVRQNNRFLSRYMIFEPFEELNNEFTIIDRYANPKQKKNPKTNKTDTYKDYQALVVTSKGRVIECQFKDRWTHKDNEKGCLNHKAYVKKQQKDLENYPEIMMFCKALQTGKPDPELLGLFRASRFRKRFDNYMNMIQACSIGEMVNETERMIALYKEIKPMEGQEESIKELETMLIETPLNFIASQIERPDYIPRTLVLNQVLKTHGIAEWEEDFLVDYALSEEIESLKGRIGKASFTTIHDEIIERLPSFAMNMKTYVKNDYDAHSELSYLAISYTMSSVMRIRETPITKVLPLILDPDSTMKQAMGMIQEVSQSFGIDYDMENSLHEIAYAAQQQIASRAKEAFQACATCSRTEGIYRSMVGFTLYSDLKKIEEMLPLKFSEEIHNTSFYFDRNHLVYLPKGMLYNDIPRGKKTNMNLLKKVSKEFTGDPDYADHVKEVMNSLKY
ncbi:MAG: hypothetical protein ACLFP2_00340 [Candidatus Woesearchaeota archaeon]